MNILYMLEAVFSCSNTQFDVTSSVPLPVADDMVNPGLFKRQGCDVAMAFTCSLHNAVILQEVHRACYTKLSGATVVQT